MPRHRQVTTCLRGGGPISKFCSCEHCCLAVCSVCGAYEGSLTTDCPGVNVSFDKQQEVCETNFDYTDELGWHQGEPTQRQTPRFESTRLLPEASHADPRATIAPSIDWTAVDRMAHLQHELAQKAIAWVIADRVTDDHSATLARLEDEIDGQIAGKLEHEKLSFHLASQRAEKCDDAFRQAARRLVAALEETGVVSTKEPSA